MLSDPRMLASLYLETERNHIRISLSVAEKFNSLLIPCSGGRSYFEIARGDLPRRSCITATMAFINTSHAGRW
jgi:hypothetical protein